METAGENQLPSQENRDRIVVDIPTPVDAVTNQPLSQHNKWLFQRFTEHMQQLEVRITAKLNGNRLLLSISYMILLVVAVPRLVIFLRMFVLHQDQMPYGDKVMVIAESSLSCGWLMYAAKQYLAKVRLAYSENVRWTSLLYLLFCVQYFSVSYWAFQAVYEFMSGELQMISLGLYLLYGFVVEKAPNMLVLSVYISLMLLLGEALVRLVICRCNNPWTDPEETPQYMRKELDVMAYDAQRFQQLTCAICLRDFVAEEKVCQMPCHVTHVFHSECLKQWLSTNNYCPFCRTSVASFS